ncbi:MAG: hypothetical protein K8I82_26730, partial [Anaerolineae bacterium]|nr:hypothetical protein [Anaerolineae bacterium]
LGFTQRQTLFVLYGVCFFFGTLGLIISAAPEEIGLKIGIVALVLLAVAFAAMMVIRERYQKPH